MRTIQQCQSQSGNRPRCTSAPSPQDMCPDLLQLIDSAHNCPHQRFLRRADVRQRTGRSIASIYNDIAAGVMPPPIPLGARSVGWLESEINAWVAARVLMARTSSAFDMKTFVARLIAPRMAGG